MTSKRNALWRRPQIQDSLVFFLLGAGLLGYALYAHKTGLPVGWEMSPYLFPLLLAVFFLLLAAALFMEGLRGAETTRPRAGNWKTVLLAGGGTVLYVVLLPLLHFFPATALFLAGLFWLLKERRVWLIALLSLATAGLLQFLFGVLLNVMLP